MAEKKRLTAAEILALNDVREDEVFVPEWDTTVTVVGLTKQQQIEINARSKVNGETDEEKAQQYMWMDGVKEPAFAEDQLPQLFQKNAGAVDRVLKRILELSGMKPEDLSGKEAAFPSGKRPSVPVRTS